MLTKKLTRRSVLRGAGAMLALPWLEAMTPLQALAGAANSAVGSAGGPPLRMGIFTVTGGTVLESFTPQEVGKLTKLPSILRPLEFAKEDLLVLSGLSQGGRSDGVNSHECCAFKHLTASEFVKREGGRIYAGVSVDQAAAQAIGSQTYLPSLEIGQTNQETRYSFRSAEVNLPYENNPRLVFERMFHGRKPVVPNWANRSKTVGGGAQSKQAEVSDDRSVIDLVLNQAKDLRGNLGRSDQQKLDGYLDSVRSVEKRLAFIESRHQQEIADLASPGPSKLNVPADLPMDGMSIWHIIQPLENDPEKHADYIRLMADLMILAFQTDTTRVCTLAAGDDGYMFPGVVTVGYERHCHTLEHQGNAGNPEEADPIAREACRQIHQWYTVLFSEMVKKMKSINEGGSTLLDNTMLLYTSYMADGGHGQNNYPFVLVGNAQGTLKTGRHVKFDNKAPTGNLYAEMLRRMGAPVDHFGDSLTSTFAGSYNGRLPDLV